MSCTGISHKGADPVQLVGKGSTGRCVPTCQATSLMDTGHQSADLSARSDTSKSPLNFLTIPPEIRLKVYENLLVSQWDPHRDRLHKITEPHPLSNTFSTNLFRTCRQIHNEAAHYFWSRTARGISLFSTNRTPHFASIWPTPDWSYQHYGWFSIYFFLFLGHDVSTGHNLMGQGLDHYCFDLQGIPIKQLIIHCWADSSHPGAFDCDCLAPLELLNGRVEEVVIGSVQDSREKGNNEKPQEVIKKVMHAVPNWTFMERRWPIG